MNPRIRLLSSILPLAFLTGCPPLPPELVTCEEADACDTTGLAATSGDWTPTTSDGVQTVTGDSPDPDASSGSTAPAEETGDEPGGTTDEPVLPPEIIDGVVIPDYIDDNGLLSVEVTAVLTEGVTMLLDDGALIELTPGRPGQFYGYIEAFTGFDNKKHTAILTPWRNVLVGESVNADYVIALPKPGSQTNWKPDGPEGHVAAIAVLPDGRPVELGTYQEMGASRCYLRLRNKQGIQEKAMDFVPLLESAYCRAIDLKIDRNTGRLNFLVERKNNVDATVWWAGEMPAWGKSLKNIGIGAMGDTALALAARPDVVAVCGTRAVDAPDAVDKLDALAVLLRPNVLPEPRVFDYKALGKKQHWFTETAHDCAFAENTLVLVGAANGLHDGGDKPEPRDRLMIIETDLVAAADDAAWTVAGLDQGVQTRALALDLDEQGRYVIGGYNCFDTCEPVGEVRVYAPGGKLAAPTFSLGPLGSAWFGPHDIAWSPAGYAVVALGGQDEQTVVFKVQAVAPGVALPLWTFIPNDKKGPQIALAVAVGPYGEVYAGGIGGSDQAAFARIGS
jgi:hypothetical protein